VSQARIPSSNGFVPFIPLVRKPRVVFYVHHSFLARFSVLPRFTEKVEVMSLDISSQNPVFGSHCHSFRLVNAYSMNSGDRRVHSVPPESLFPDTGVPLLVVGDLNIYKPQADRLHSFHRSKSPPPPRTLSGRRWAVSPYSTPQECIQGYFSQERQAPPLSTFLLPTPCCFLW